jgi:hypothetical protein
MEQRLTGELRVNRDPRTIEVTLASVDSYGLAFVGFDEEVTGWLRLEAMRFYGSVTLNQSTAIP